MYLDASELIRYRAPGTDGGAHSDIFRPATGRLLWNVIEKPAPGSEVPGALPADLRGFWGYFFPIAITLATSALYELAEWGAAEVFGGDLGVAFLGTQGDVWDAQKDMALAGSGQSSRWRSPWP